MFSNVAASYQQKKITTGITGLAAAGGLTYSLVKKKSFWGVVGFTAAAALVGYIATASVYNLTKKD